MRFSLYAFPVPLAARLFPKTGSPKENNMQRTLTAALALILVPGLALAAGDFAPYGSSEPMKVK